MASLRPLAVLIAAGALVGCSNNYVPQPVPAEDVAAEITAKLEEETGTAPEGVTCPGELPAEVDAEIVCEYTAGDPPESFVVTVTVMDVDEDGNVVFSMVAEPAPELPPA